MTYKLGRRSRQRLLGIHPDLVIVIRRAITITPIDFSVLAGLRTLDQQRRLMAQGATTTLNSRHLTGHAIDLGAYVNGSIQWDWPLYYQIAEAIKQAAQQFNIPIEWGGSWSCINQEADLTAAVARYCARQQAQGKKPFVDGGHFQLPWKNYPSEPTNLDQP